MTHTFLLFPDFKLKAVTLSYDDGTVTDKRLAEIADAYGLKCTFNICSELLAREEGGRMLTETAAVKLYAESGHEVAVHGAQHMSLPELSDGLATRELIRDKENLERLFGRIVYGMAYANGKYDDRTVETVRRCGLRFARTVKATLSFDLPDDFLKWDPTCHHDEPRLDELVEEFLPDAYDDYFFANKPKLFYLWGHSVEFERNKNWHVLENFAKKVGNRDDIFYATNGEICTYVEAYRALRTSADGKIIHNPTCTDVFLNYFGKKVCIGAGQTVHM